MFKRISEDDVETILSENIVVEVKNNPKKRYDVDKPTDEIGWEKVCFDRWPGLLYVTDTDDSVYNYHHDHNIKTYEQLYMYLNAVENDWYVKDKDNNPSCIDVKVISRPESNNDTALFYPVGVSKKFAVVIKSRVDNTNISEEEVDYENVVGRVYYLNTNGSEIVVKGDDNNPKRWRPKWRLDKHVKVHNLKMARLCDNEYLIIITEEESNVSNNNNNGNRQLRSSLYKVTLSGLLLISEHDIPEIPTVVAGSCNFCAYGYESGDNQGITVLFSPYFNEGFKLTDEPVHSISLSRDLNNNVTLLCGLSDGSGTTMGMNLGSGNKDSMEFAIDEQNNQIWYRSFWPSKPSSSSSSSDNSIPAPEITKLVIDEKNDGVQYVQTNYKEIMFIRRTPNNEDLNVNHIYDDVGSIIGLDMCCNLVAIHHKTNDIMIVHHTSGLPAQQVINIRSNLGVSIESQRFYDSVVAFSERIVVMLPDTSLVFLCLKRRNKYN